MPSNAATIQPDAIAHGHHVCGLYESRAEQEELFAEFVRAGLSRGERVRCVVHQTPPDELLEWLAADGVDANGALDVVSSTESYLLDASFDPDRMAARLHGAIDEALAAGFNGFRVAGEMSWALDAGILGAGRLEAYEARMVEVVAARPAAALCLYDRRRFDEAQSGAAVGLHDGVARLPTVSEDGQLRIHRLDGDGLRLRIAGEADLASSPALAAALGTANGGDVHLDIGRLRFMDLSATRVLAEFGAGMAPSRRFELHGASPSVRRLIDILGTYLARAEVTP